MGPLSADLFALQVPEQRTLDEDAGEHLGPVVRAAATRSASRRGS
ncbi:hypothetical protein D187_007465 [Cystobacter fuscus DSM 2262]|uniref:Uncharacterized protein n=1 Tax=Cystobacter fuscus (strain ATCC 25194 / DSM 2262 / NBRC 100088 / M29) TaxID=1242864 RepID=S9QI69_CYSF2|nr:hypothetical protein D187_007465 [Cystobacter fuscus DSM 2262]